MTRSTTGSEGLNQRHTHVCYPRQATSLKHMRSSDGHISVRPSRLTH